MKGHTGKLFHRVSHLIYEKYGSTKWGIFGLTVIAVCIIGTCILESCMFSIHGGLQHTMAFIVVLLGASLIFFAASFIGKCIKRYGAGTFFCILVLNFLANCVFLLGKTPQKISWKAALLVVFIECILARCLYALFHNHKKSVLVILPIVSAAIANVMLIYFCLKAGYSNEYVKNICKSEPAAESYDKCFSYKKTHVVKSFTYVSVIGDMAQIKYLWREKSGIPKKQERIL